MIYITLEIDSYTGGSKRCNSCSDEKNRIFKEKTIACLIKDRK